MRPVCSEMDVILTTQMSDLLCSRLPRVLTTCLVVPEDTKTHRAMPGECTHAHNDFTLTNQTSHTLLAKCAHNDFIHTKNSCASFLKENNNRSNIMFSEPHSKRTKLNSLRQSRRQDCADVAKAFVYSTDMASASEDSRLAGTCSEIKSGNLVMISSPLHPTWTQRTRSRSCPRSDDVSTRHPLRCPVIVQVHKKRYEHYAVVRKTKNRQTEQPLYLNLSKSSACLSDSRPCQFTVYLNSAEGKSFTFEASNPEAAKDWVRALTPAVPGVTSELVRTPRLRKPLENVNSVIMEEEEGQTMDSSPCPSPHHFISPSLEKTSKLNSSELAPIWSTNCLGSKSPISNAASRRASRNSGKTSRLCTGNELEVGRRTENSTHCFTLTISAGRSHDGFEPIARASSMPVLFEEGEEEEEEEVNAMEEEEVFEE
ncbi:uncharacterized protein LOC118477253 [Aplysia californica]|uniref:Uncharacterized protein LOC118477253 n=1 Tax=Aplysia californica TaxID=6500 RepID=A0ABM1VP78_APLCA|nr:uncharacterized protein LOC118477253 [Aplysia californica]